MRFLSVCSGIEAASVAWGPLGWQAAAFSEIEPFPCAVLAHHYPDVPNLGDMTRFREWPDYAIDLLCGGTPCQSFSVAGLRKGLDDPRGNLMLTFGAIAARYRPRWLVWENVPGVLSSNKGRDFGTFLGMLGQLGYGFAYRVLDAQYFGVAQRRRRVFVVGCLGDWRRAAAVLFERHSLSWHPAPSREARQVAPTIPARSTGGGGLGTDFDCDGGLIQAFGGNRTSGSIEVAPALLAQPGSGWKGDFESETFITHSLRGEGFDASEDGTGRGTPLVPVAFTQNSRSEVREIGGDGQIVGALAADAGAQQQNCIAFSAKDHGADATTDLAPTLRAMGHADSHANGGGQIAVATGFAWQAGGDGTSSGAFVTEGSPTLQRAQTMAVQQAMQVRRLTPEECEALQGFPRCYTAIPWRGKPADQCPDGPRYKALGNAWAVPVVRWIGERINAVEQIKHERKAA